MFCILIHIRNCGISAYDSGIINTIEGFKTEESARNALKEIEKSFRCTSMKTVFSIYEKD